MNVYASARSGRRQDPRRGGRARDGRRLALLDGRLLEGDVEERIGNRQVGELRRALDRAASTAPAALQAAATTQPTPAAVIVLKGVIDEYSRDLLFKRRFVPEDPSPQMTEGDRSLLYCLLLQSRTLAAQ